MTACTSARPALSLLPVPLAVVLALTGACQRAQRPISTGELMAESTRYQLAVYLPPDFDGDALQLLDATLADLEPVFERVGSLPDTPDRPLLAARLNADVRRSYAPPTEDTLRHSGRGLAPEQARALSRATHALVIDFAVGRADVFPALRGACALLHELGLRTGGLLWDEETREVFTPGAWRKGRIDGWTGGVPDVSRHLTIHVYRDDDLVRAITLGMAKLALPDLVVERFSWSLQRPVGHLVNLTAQALAEGRRPERQGELTLRLADIGHEAVRTPQLASLLEGATAEVLLSLREGVRDEGDPDNRLIEIGFDRHPGRDEQARQTSALAALFGAAEDRATEIEHTAELTAASQRARSRLPALRADFDRGLAPGEYLQVKAPFETPDGGTEWMWVDVVRWRGTRIDGLLANDPVHIPSLHAGQAVAVSEDDLFDYIRRYPDGREEGNETGAIIARLSAGE